MEDPPTDGSPKYARELIYRARSSLNESSKLNNTHMIEHTIELTRELHALTTRNSADGVVASLFLAESLRQSFQVHGTNGLLEEIINIGREAVTFCPEKHPNRASSCRNLAQSLKTRYNCTGDAGLLDEAMDLGREALRLQPVGHPDRSAYCNSLARLLSARYERTGDAGFLDEAIDLEREVLDLCPARHPDRSAYCINLARSLTARYKRTGNVGFLDEAIDLEREALGLCPAGHPDRSVSCNSLGSSLLTRYERTGDVGSYDEGIDIQREALRLRPVGHPDRATSCGNLAGSLKIHYERTSDVGLLDEAIDLQREALNLRPVGHLDRSMSCISFANLLRTHFLRTGDVGVLHEAIDLEREALDLCPVGRPDRSMTCGSLARSLNVYFEYTGDIALFQESLTLFQEAISISPLHEIWRHSCALAWTFLRRTSPYYDVRKAILYLSQSLTHDADDPVAFVLALSSLLDYIWLCNLEGDYIQLTTVYRRLVNLLPLLIHPAVGLQSQLQALKKCNRLGSDAFVNAALANDWSIGLETLELAQGVIWSTSLHRRDPQLKDVPDHLASRLQDVLQSIAMSSAARPDHNEWKPFISPRDILHTQSSRLYTVLRDIRALPGLERFMLGESVDALRTAASDHPVVVLVGAREHYYALILAASLVNGHMVLSLHLSDEHLTSLSYTRGSTRAHRSDATPEETPDEGARRGFNKTESAPSKPLDGQLQTLWHKVVKPVLAQLGLEVSNRP
jgi:tetratricopeptide (TPR) repeat protein